MHHFIYPSQDTFITNNIEFESLNFGLDEILNIGTSNVITKIISPTTNVPISQSVSNLCVINFSGSIFDSIIYGTSSIAIGNISSSTNENVSASNFNGTLMGSYFSSSLETSSSFTGSLTDFSGSFSGIFSGSVSGSFWTDYLDYFNGSVMGFSGKIVTGSIVGINILPHQSTFISENIYSNRALIQFDITSISKSIADGDIIDPQFKLKLKVARELNLPINYSIYAFPIFESWVMGDGYLSDGGSTQGASWLYRDFQGGTLWSNTGSTYIRSLNATQSFSYQVGDINMDITPIANAWLSGTLVNNGVVLINGDEFSSTGVGMDILFFSKDTNTIYEPVLDVSWDDVSFLTGSVTTSSINISTIPAGLFGIVSDSGSLTGNIYGGFSGVGNINMGDSGSASGLISVVGTSGLIISMSIFGDFSGSIISFIVSSSVKCRSCIPDSDDFSFFPPMDVIGWGGNLVTNWWPWDISGSMINADNDNDCDDPISFTTMSVVMGTLIDGNFSGSVFTSSVINGYILNMGILSGSWNESMILGTTISASYPFKPMFPLAINVVFSGVYINGPAFGSITDLSSSTGVIDSGVFDGVFTGGIFSGIKIHAPFTGSILTSSYDYTASLNITTSSLFPVDVRRPFTTIIQNIPSSVKAGDVIKVNVFSRPEFPIKNFNRQTQFSQFLIPQFLPSSSFYAIKDNETEQIIVDFDQHTQLSCDPSGNYFMLDTTGYPQERYFRILIRVEHSGVIYTFDKSNIFKIVR